MHRWTVAPGASAARETPIDSRAIEFPRIDERLNGLPHRFAYAPTGENLAADEEENFSQLARYDMASGACTTRDFGRGGVMSAGSSDGGAAPRCAALALGGVALAMAATKLL